jgi:hypothetical protein
MLIKFISAYCISIFAMLVVSPFIFGRSVLLDPIVVENVSASSVQVFLELSKFTGTIMMALMGASAFLSIRKKDYLIQNSRFYDLLIMISVLLSTVALYGLFSSYSRALGMISSGIFDANEWGLSISLDLQYYGAGGAAFCLGLVLLIILFSDTKPEK